MDVVLVSGSYHPREGGAERQMRALLPQFLKSGYEVAVITQVIPGRNLPRVETVDGYQVYRVGSERAFRYVPRIGQAIYFVSAAAKALCLKPRTLLSLQMGSATAAAGVAAHLLSARHIVRLTGGGTSKHRSEPVARASSRLGRLLVRPFWRQKTILVAPARHLLADFESSFEGFPGVSQHIINGVIKPTDAPKKDKDVVWYGRSGSEKSLHILAEIAAALPDRKFSVMGRVAGESLPSNVLLSGWQNEPEAFIGQHHVLLNTSASEGMPNTVLQAIAWGCHVVGFENAGMCEVQAMYPDVVHLAPSGHLDSVVRLLEDALSSPTVPLGTVDVASVEDVEAQWTQLLVDDRSRNVTEKVG